jgi:hypothetical protein
MSTETASPPSERADPLQAFGARPYARRGVSTRDEPVRVLRADAHAVVRAGLEAVLAAAPDVTVLGAAASGGERVALGVSHFLPRRQTTSDDRRTAARPRPCPALGVQVQTRPDIAAPSRPLR